MLSRSSKLTAIGVFFALISLTQSSRTSLREKNVDVVETEIEAEAEIEYVTLEDIDAMIELMEFENLAAGEGGLRKLQDNTCWHGGQANQILTMAGRQWGSCMGPNQMHECVCGLAPKKFAAWCPNLCRPNNCGGECANPQKCPRGYNIVNGQVVKDYIPAYIHDDYPLFWPANWGSVCRKYPNPGEPGFAQSGPSPTPATPQQKSNQCVSYNKKLNNVCTATACCEGNLICKTMPSTGISYCGMDV